LPQAIFGDVSQPVPESLLPEYKNLGEGSQAARRHDFEFWLAQRKE